MKVIISILALVMFSGCLFSQTEPEWMWATQAGGNGVDYGQSIAVDEDGHSYVTGYFSDSVSFGTTTLLSSGLFDIFVAKLDSNGNYLWAKSAGGLSDDYGYSIAIDSSGSCYVTGCFMFTATFGTNTISANGVPSDIFIAKLDSNGNWLWVTSAGGMDEDKGYGIAVDVSGNCYTTGHFSATAAFGATSLTSIGDRDVFIAKLNSGGNWLWAVRAGGDDNDIGRDIDVDCSGSCYLTGFFYGTATFGTSTFTNNSNSDIFVARLDTNGNWLWAKRAGGTSRDYAEGIATDGDGNCCITGYFMGTATFGSTTYTSTNQYCYEIFVAKLDSSGNWIWAQRAVCPYTGYGDNIVMDDNGSIYVSGCFQLHADFGTTSITSSGNVDVFAAKLDSNGNWLWATKAGGTDGDASYGIGIDISGNSYITGVFDTVATFGQTQLTSNGEGDIFVAKLASDGTSINDEVTPGITSLSHLNSAYPNPMHKGNASTIKAEIAPSETGSITIYNLKGQVIESHQLSSGSHSISFDGNDLAAGIYLYRLKTPSVNKVRKLILLSD